MQTLDSFQRPTTNSGNSTDSCFLVSAFFLTRETVRTAVARRTHPISAPGAGVRVRQRTRRDTSIRPQSTADATADRCPQSHRLHRLTRNQWHLQMVACSADGWLSTVAALLPRQLRSFRVLRSASRTFDLERVSWADRTGTMVMTMALSHLPLVQRGTELRSNSGPNYWTLQCDSNHLSWQASFCSGLPHPPSLRQPPAR